MDNTYIIREAISDDAEKMVSYLNHAENISFRNKANGRMKFVTIFFPHTRRKKIPKLQMFCVRLIWINLVYLPRTDGLTNVMKLFDMARRYEKRPDGFPLGFLNGRPSFACNVTICSQRA